MVSAPLRPCAGNCGALVVRGRCSACRRVLEQRRGTATARGYGAHWVRFRRQVLADMVELGILAVCGATLPDGPVTQDSHCKAQGLFTFASGDADLHLDHEPPLREDERCDDAAVCDPLRIQLLCASCHAVKTRRERHWVEPVGECGVDLARGRESGAASK